MRGILTVLFLLLISPAWGEEGKGSNVALKGLTLTSDRLEYSAGEENFIAEGNVTLLHDALELRLDTLRFNNTTRQLKGSGNVSFLQSGNTLSATTIEYDLSTGQGILSDGRFFIEAEQYTLTGQLITRVRADHYKLQGASFTACDCSDDPDWQIRAEAIDVTLNRYLTAKNLVFEVNGWPILVLPYAIYPVNTTRQSGFLVPDVGYSRQRGLRYSQEFFWAPTSDQDATLSFDYRDQKGSGGGVEYRYAFSETTRGELQLYAFHDLERQINRQVLYYRHAQRFSNRVAMNMNIQAIKPTGSLSDLSDTLASRAQQVVESAAHLTYTGNNAFAYLLVRDTQEITHPENRLRQGPEAGGRLIEYPIGPFFYDGGLTYTRYERDVMTWERADLSQKISLPLRFFPGLTLTPWIGVHPVGYSRAQMTDEPFYRNVVARGVHLYTDWLGILGKHRVTQEIFFEAIKTEDRSDIIKADELDGLHNRRSVTALLYPQFSTFLTLQLSETYQLPSSLLSPATYSDLRGQIAVHPAPFVSLEAESFYNWDNQNITGINADLDLHVTNRVKMVLGRSFTRGDSIPSKGDPFNPYYLGDRVTTPRRNVIRGQGWIRLGREFRLAGQVFYDEDDNRPIETHYGILYLKQCHSMTLTYQGLPDRDEFFFSVHLKGLGPLIPKRFAYLFDF